MTSLAFLLGVAPLVVATGAGAEMRQSLGTAVFGGMLGVTAFGLIFTPAFYALVGVSALRRSNPSRHRSNATPASTPPRPGLISHKGMPLDQRGEDVEGASPCDIRDHGAGQLIG